MGMRRLASRLAAGAFGASCAMALAGQAMAEELVGQPTPGAIDLQRGVTPLRHDAEWFHNTILLPMCVGISLLVLVLLLICVVRFNRKANPVPARWSHNTKLEVIWKSPDLPESAIVYREELPADLRAKIADFFTHYGQAAGAEGERQKAIMAKLHYTAFHPADDSYLKPVREMRAATGG